MDVFERNGVRLHIADEGPRDGAAPALVFANSLGTDFRVWDPLLPHLPSDRRLIRWDKRGHGLSDAPPAPYAMDDHVDDLIALLDHLGVRGAVIVGLSIGGLIAQGVAAKRPDLVSALALLDTAAKIGNAALWNDRIAAIEANGVEGLADAVMERWFSAKFRAENPTLSLWRNMLTRTTVDGYAGSCAAIRDADFTESTRGLSTPTLCVVGTEDGSTPPEVVKGLADLIPGAGYLEIDGVGHIPCVEAPDRLGAALRQFLADRGV